MSGNMIYVVCQWTIFELICYTVFQEYYPILRQISTKYFITEVL